MTDPTARAVSSIAVAAASCGIAFASPMLAAMAVTGMIIGIYLIWITPRK